MSCSSPRQLAVRFEGSRADSFVETQVMKGHGLHSVPLIREGTAGTGSQSNAMPMQRSALERVIWGCADRSRYCMRSGRLPRCVLSAILPVQGTGKRDPVPQELVPQKLEQNEESWGMAGKMAQGRYCAETPKMKAVGAQETLNSARSRP